MNDRNNCEYGSTCTLRDGQCRDCRTFLAKIPPSSDGQVDFGVIGHKLIEYLAHDKWRCKHYKKCHCGLDELCDKIGIERISYDICL